MGQVAALARTFREYRPTDSDRENLPHLVRRISLDACVVVPMFAEVVREDLEFVLQACTHLQSFSCRAVEGFSVADLSSCFHYYVSLDPTETGLSFPQVQAIEGMRERQLHLAPPAMCFGRITPLLASAAYLAKLSLGTFPDWDESELELATLPSLYFPLLEDLQLPFTRPHKGLQDYVCALWRLPALVALTLTDCYEYTTRRLLEAHGAQLKYLHFHKSHYSNVKAQTAASLSIFSQLGHLCPAVEHLVIPALHAQSADVRSPTLRYLDFLCFHDPSFLEITLSETAHVPRLTSTRSIRYGEIFFPHACHPSLIPADRPDMQIVHFFKYRRVVQTRTFVKYDGGKSKSAQHLYYEDGEEIDDPDDDSDSWKTVCEGEEGEGDDEGDVHEVKAKPMPEDEGSLFEPSSGSEDETSDDDSDSWSASGDEPALPQNYEEDPELQNDRDAARRYLLERLSFSQRCAFLTGDADEEDEDKKEAEGVKMQTAVSVEGQDARPSSGM